MRRTFALGVVATLAITFTLSTAGTAQGPGAFTATLSGAQQVSPVNTGAVGNAVVVVSPTGGVSYMLIVNNAVAVVAAHIHCAPFGVNGPVGVTLFLGAPVSQNGVLAAGPILAPDTPDDNPCGWEDLDDLIDAMESGDTYVNVHTFVNQPGEIRGQLQ